MNDIEFALQVASNAHAGQVDKAGAPYILHVMRVASACDPTDTDSVVAALLHDTVEDSNLTVESIQKSFGPAVAEIVDSLTRQKEEDYPTYLRRLKLCSKAVVIKRFDLLDNLRFDRLSLLPENERTRLWRKYSDAFAELTP